VLIWKENEILLRENDLLLVLQVLVLALKLNNEVNDPLHLIPHVEDVQLLED
jgi:hypothetical protein